MAGTPAIAAATPQPAAPQPVRYVAMGDSFAAGPGIAPTINSSCRRSGNAYPELVAQRLRVASVTNVTCSGAKLADMTSNQTTPVGLPAGGPQLDALRPDTNLVTVNFGINDSMILAAYSACAFIGPLFPQSAPCAFLLNPLGLNFVATQLTAQAAVFDANIRAIHQRSPAAKVLVVGLPTFLPEASASCFSFATGDIGYLGGLITALNQMLRGVAERTGSTYVDVAEGSKGHDMCQPAAQRWIEGPILSVEPAPLHPNKAGQDNVARQILAALG